MLRVAKNIHNKRQEHSEEKRPITISSSINVQSTHDNVASNHAITISIERTTQTSIIDKLLDEAKHQLVAKLRDYIKAHFRQTSFYDLIMENKLIAFLNKHPRIRDAILNRMNQQLDQYINQFYEAYTQKLQEHRNSPINPEFQTNGLRPPSPLIEKRLPTKRAETPPALRPTPKPRALTLNPPAYQGWIIDHSIIQSVDKSAKETHITFLCNNDEEQKKIIQAQLLLNDASKGRFVDLLRKHCIDQPEIICNILNTFQLHIKDIKAYVDTQDLKNNVRNYLMALPKNQTTLDLLERCVVKNTSIGQFCWTRAIVFSFFPAYYLATDDEPTKTVRLLRLRISEIKNQMHTIAAQQLLQSLILEEQQVQGEQEAQKDRSVKITPSSAHNVSEKKDAPIIILPESDTPQQNTGGYLFMLSVLSCFIIACVAVYCFSNKEEKATESTMRL